MVSNLVSNQDTPASARAYPALPYMSLTHDWDLIIVNWLHQAVSVGVDVLVGCCLTMSFNAFSIISALSRQPVGSAPLVIKRLE